MKKLLVILVGMALLVSCILPALAQGSQLGGWQITEEAAVPNEVRLALEKTLEGLVGAQWEPVALLGTQIVAGTNYCLLCRIIPVVPEPAGHYALVYLYVDLQGNAEILGSTDLDIDALNPLNQQ